MDCLIELGFNLFEICSGLGADPLDQTLCRRIPLTHVSHVRHVATQLDLKRPQKWPAGR